MSRSSNFPYNVADTSKPDKCNEYAKFTTANNGLQPPSLETLLPFTYELRFQPYHNLTLNIQ